MEDKKRPGGLTALAVINFIFAAGAIMSIINLITINILRKMPMEQVPEAQKATIEAIQNMGHSMLIIYILISLISFILLLLSGIGYLKLKKVLGRLFGNFYGILGVLLIIISTTIWPKELRGGFSIMTIIGFIYPVLTLILLNTTFKDDLVN